MKPCPKYKDSGVEWIGEIPAHWKILPIRALCHLGRGRVISNEEIARNPGEYPVYSSQTANNGEMGRINSYDFDGEYVTWTTDGANAGTVFYRYGKFNCNCTNVCGTLKSKNKLCTPLLPYILNLGTRYYVRYDINPKLMNNMIAKIKISVPPYLEQTTIAAYLDRKTIQIDNLISKKQKLIELLKEERAAIINQAVTKGLNPDAPMKDSGIEWLGEVPEHWEVKRLKFLANKVGSGVTPRGGASVYQKDGIPLLRSQNIHFEGLKLDDVAYISEEIHNEMSGSKVKPNDVSLNITGASIGRCCIVPSDFGEANVNQHVCIIRPNRQIESGFLHNYISSDNGQVQIFSSEKGISREGLNFEQLKGFQVLLPPIADQKDIKDYIESATTKIDQTISNIEKQIDLLQEYRTALISEVVTGKIDVRT